MDLIAFWNVVKRQQRIVVIGLCAAAALAVIALVKPTASGLSWRTPPVYDGTTTLLVTKPGFARETGRPLDGILQTTGVPRPASTRRLAESDRIERAASRKLGVEGAGLRGGATRRSRWPSAAAHPDPCVRDVARGSGRARERDFQCPPDLSRGSRRTIASRARTVSSCGWSRRQRRRGVQGRPSDAADHAVPPGRAADVGGRFRRGQLPRRPPVGAGAAQRRARTSPRHRPKRARAATDGEDNGRVQEAPVRMQPPDAEAEEANAETSPARGRWATPS